MFNYFPAKIHWNVPYKNEFYCTFNIFTDYLSNLIRTYAICILYFFIQHLLFWLYSNKWACLLKLDQLLLASLGYMWQSLGDICQVIKPSTFHWKAAFALKTFCSNTICSQFSHCLNLAKGFLPPCFMHACTKMHFTCVLLF